MTTLLDETVAAELEGLSALTPEQDAIRQKWLALDAAEKELKARKAALRDELGAHLVEGGLSGLTVDGKVVVRLSNVTTLALDTAALKKSDPNLFASLMERFTKVTRAERVSIK